MIDLHKPILVQKAHSLHIILEHHVVLEYGGGAGLRAEIATGILRRPGGWKGCA